MIYSFVPDVGVGYISTDKGFVSVYVFGHFVLDGLRFMVHSDFDNPEDICVSEVSSGANCGNYVYDSIDSVLENFEGIFMPNRAKARRRVREIINATGVDLSSLNTNVISPSTLTLWNA